MRSQTPWRTPSSCRAAAILCLGALAHCDERPDAFDESLGLSTPYLAEGHAAVLSRGRRAVLVIDPDSGGVDVVGLSGEPHTAAVLPDGESLLILSPADEALELVDVAGAKISRSWPTRSPFDSITLSDDGRFAVLSFAGGGVGGFSNASEIGVVDLEAEASDTNPSVRTVASAGGAVVGLDISDGFAGGRRIALVRSTNHIAALDLSAPLGNTRSIPLVSPGSGTTVTPTRVVFDVDGDALDVFVVTAGIEDVYHLRFDGTADANGAPLPTLNQFAVGGGPSDLVVWRDGGGTRRLLVASAFGKSLTVIDVKSAQSSVLPLGAAAGRILLYGAAGDAQRALVYGPAGASTRFWRVALGEIATKKSKAVQAHDLVAPISTVGAVADGAWFLVTHPSWAPVVVTLVSATDSRILPFTGGGNVFGHAVAQDGGAVLLAAFDGAGVALSTIDIASGHPETRKLRDLHGASTLSAIPGTDWLLVTQTRPEGAATLIDGSVPEDGEVIELPALGLVGVLDGEGGL